MSPRLLKLIGYFILAAVIGFIGYLFIGFLFFSYNAKTLVTGCEEVFCVDQTKSQVVALFDGEYSFDSGHMVPYDPTIEPDTYIYTGGANTIEELIERDRWAIIYGEEKGWQKFVHLHFKDEVLYQIEIVNYGPFYMDP